MCRLLLRKPLGDAEQYDADDDGNDAGVLGGLELFLNDQAGQDDRNDAVRSHHRCSQNRLCGHRVNIEDLAEFLATGGDSLVPLALFEGVIEGAGLCAKVDPANNSGDEKCDAVQDDDINLADAETGFLIEDDAVRSSADGIENTVKKRENQSERTHPVAALFFRYFVFLFGKTALHNGKRDDAEHDQYRADDVKNAELLGKTRDFTDKQEIKEHADGRKRTGSVLHRRNDGELQIAEAGVSDYHGNDVAKGSRRILQGHLRE